MALCTGSSKGVVFEIGDNVERMRCPDCNASVYAYLTFDARGYDRYMLAEHHAAKVDLCVYCGCEIDITEAPPADDDRMWRAAAREHAPNCEWIATRAHTRDEPMLRLGACPACGGDGIWLPGDDPYCSDACRENA